MKDQTSEYLRELAASFVIETYSEGLARQRTEFRAAIRTAADEIDRLRKVIEDAPHYIDCASGTLMNAKDYFPCNCWKAGAL